MDRQGIIKYIKNKYQVSPEYLFGDDTMVFRNRNNKKWFGIIMNVEYNKVFKDSDKDDLIDVLNVKLPVDFVNGIKNTTGFAPAYHMNKKHWLSVLINNVGNDKIKSLIDMSFDMVERKYKKDGDN